MGNTHHSRASMHLNNHRGFSRNPRVALIETAAEISEPTSSTQLIHRESTPSRRATPSQERKAAVKTCDDTPDMVINVPNAQQAHAPRPRLAGRWSGRAGPQAVPHVDHRPALPNSRRSQKPTGQRTGVGEAG